jgi:hypothetical protein
MQKKKLVLIYSTGTKKNPQLNNHEVKSVKREQERSVD